jgi:hypothetical protein
VAINSASSRAWAIFPVCRGRHSRASTGRHTGRDRNDSCTTMPATTQQLPKPMGFRALRGAVVMPRRPEDFLPGPLEQGVVDRDRERGSRREQPGHDQIGQGQSQRITRPAGVGEQSVRAAVMPHLIQPGAGKHPTHRSTPGLRDQTDHQPDEALECRCGEARAELGKQTGQRARGGGAGRHRRITLTRTVQERSMLSSSPSKIHEPRVTGVSPRPTDQRQRQENCETRGARSATAAWPISSSPTCSSTPPTARPGSTTASSPKP